MPVPQEILKLVERFDAQSEAYQSGKYNEAQRGAKIPVFLLVSKRPPATFHLLNKLMPTEGIALVA